MSYSHWTYYFVCWQFLSFNPWKTFCCPGCGDCRKLTILHSLSPVTAEGNHRPSPWFLKFLPLAWLSRFSFVFFSRCWLWASLGLLCLFCPHLWVSRFLGKFYSLFLLSLFFSSFHMSPHFLRGVLCSLNDVNLSSYWACLFPISWVLCCLILVV